MGNGGGLGGGGEIYYEGEQLKDKLQIIPAAISGGQRHPQGRDRIDGLEQRR